MLTRGWHKHPRRKRILPKRLQILKTMQLARKTNQTKIHPRRKPTTSADNDNHTENDESVDNIRAHKEANDEAQRHENSNTSFVTRRTRCAVSGKTSKPRVSDQNHNPFGDDNSLSDTASESSVDLLTGRKKRKNKRLCRKRNRSAQLYEEVKQWTKNPRLPDIPEPPPKSKEEIRLEKLAKKAKEGEKEWNDFVMQEEMITPRKQQIKTK